MDLKWRAKNRAKSGREMRQNDAVDAVDTKIKMAECKSVWELQCTGLITC